MRPCVLRDGGPCFMCKEDMELEQKILELQDRRRILRTHMNASHDPFHFKFPPEIASLIFYLSMTEQDHEPSVRTLRLLPTPFLLGSVSRRLIGGSAAGTLDTSTLANPLIYPRY